MIQHGNRSLQSSLGDYSSRITSTSGDAMSKICITTFRRLVALAPFCLTLEHLVNQYLVNGASGIEQLYIEDKRSLSDSIHTWIYGGILETMYGGVGGEVLYSPYLQRWALGLNVNAVKQRGFERDFDFRDYETVTAFASAYYASPFFDVDMAVHVGSLS